ncbi:DUF371 domain-containing protein [Candidatus Woesearchaeota archaeon]|nr:DUF371 domain-containing protein [Candidatus Woesearchaeota archaeon]
MYQFTAKGHPSVKALHKTTLEFTKDENLTDEGDCIVGIKATFDKEKLKQEMQGKDSITVTITAGRLSDVVRAIPNPLFDDDRELVIRMGEHASPRTFAVRADKSAAFLNRSLVAQLKTSPTILVSIE